MFNIVHRQEAEYDGRYRAEYFANIRAMKVTIYLAPWWEFPVTKKAISMTAFHEVSEIMLVKLRWLISDHFEDDRDQFTHEIIHKLASIFKPGIK